MRVRPKCIGAEIICSYVVPIMLFHFEFSINFVHQIHLFCPILGHNHRLATRIHIGIVWDAQSCHVAESGTGLKWGTTVKTYHNPCQHFFCGVQNVCMKFLKIFKENH